MSYETLTLCLGIIDPTVVDVPEGPPESSYRRGNFNVQVWGEVAVLSCLCGRSEPIPVTLKDLKKASPLHGLEACKICVDEINACKSRTEHVQAWVNRNRYAIDNGSHIFFPENLSRLVLEGHISRPRRSIYQMFYGKDLQKKDKIICTCDEPNCLNPYHMMSSKSTATKVTPQMLEDIKKWIHQNINTKAIQQELKDKYHRKLSTRTIQMIRKEQLAFVSTMS